MARRGRAPRGTLSPRGAAAVEFALVMPFLLFLLFEIISFAYMMSFRAALSQAASEAARSAVGADLVHCSGSWGAGCDAYDAAWNSVGGSLSGYASPTRSMACGPNVHCDISRAPTVDCASGRSCIKVAVSYAYRDNPLLPVVHLPAPFDAILPARLGFTSIVQVN